MLQNQTLSAIISSLRAFDLFSDTLDILIISFVFYQLIQFARKSRAGQLVKGIALPQVDRLLLEVQPAHLQTAAGRLMGTEERDAARAARLRAELGRRPPAQTKSEKRTP